MITRPYLVFQNKQENCGGMDNIINVIIYNIMVIKWKPRRILTSFTCCRTTSALCGDHLLHFVEPLMHTHILYWVWFLVALARVCGKKYNYNQNAHDCVPKQFDCWLFCMKVQNVYLPQQSQRLGESYPMPAQTLPTYRLYKRQSHQVV